MHAQSGQYPHNFWEKAEVASELKLKKFNLSTYAVLKT